MEYFTADFFAIFYRKTLKHGYLGGRLGTNHQIQAFQEFS